MLMNNEKEQEKNKNYCTKSCPDNWVGDKVFFPSLY